VTRDGRLKVLDFGLGKRVALVQGSGNTSEARTGPGMAFLAGLNDQRRRHGIRIFSSRSAPLSQHLLAEPGRVGRGAQALPRWLFPASLINPLAAVHE
jgi:hypothetical protein